MCQDPTPLCTHSNMKIAHTVPEEDPAVFNTLLELSQNGGRECLQFCKKCIRTYVDHNADGNDGRDDDNGGGNGGGNDGDGDGNDDDDEDDGNDDDDDGEDDSNDDGGASTLIAVIGVLHLACGNSFAFLDHNHL